MDTAASTTRADSRPETLPARGLALTGARRTLALAAWSLITLLSLLSFALAVFSVYAWDGLPATDARLPRYFPSLTPEDVHGHAGYQQVVLEAGFSLAGYALIFAVARVIGGLALFLVSFLLVRRHSGSLMAVLMAAELSVLGAAGTWGNPLWVWTVAFAPWLRYPAALLGWLLWCGVIVLYTFPDGRFVPRWTFWLAVLVVPLSFFTVLDVKFFLNWGTWPDTLALVPNLIFIGGALVAVLYRAGRKTETDRRRSMRWYALGLSPLLALYFVDFFINEVYYTLAGQPLIQGLRAGMLYVLAYEPLWYALQVFFAVALAVAVFRPDPKGLLDS